MKNQQASCENIQEALAPQFTQKNDQVREEKPVFSQFFEQYNQEMIFYDSLVDKQYEKLRQKMMKQQIYCSHPLIQRKQRQMFQRKMTIKVKRETINKEVLVISIQWGLYQTQAKVLNIQKANKGHGVSASSGCYGNIYQGTFMNNKIAMKCIPIKSKSTRFNAIKEWFLLKIASAAEFGPKLFRCFGFDILMFQTCCQFAMEVCQIPTGPVNSHHMFWNLAMMHRLHIVHMDIKPQNIMLSHSFKKPVFIDFGLSKMIWQDIGQKSLTEFIGTITFCTEQMSKCFLEKTSKSVDLYMNDLYGLRLSLKVISQIQISEQMQQNISMVNLFKQNDFSYLNGIILKFSLFQNNIENFFFDLESNICLKENSIHKRQALIFLLQLVPNHDLKNVFLRIVKEYEIETQLYSRIKLFFELSSEKIRSSQSFRDEEKYKYFSQICQEMSNENQKQKQVQQNNSRQIFQLLSNQQNIKKLSFEKYVQAYLQFMSYFHNKYQTTALQRKKAATIYYSMFISKESHQLSKERQIIKRTIKHILQWGLQSSKLAEHTVNFALFAFRIYDFLVIVESQHSSQFIALSSSILNHSALSLTYKRILLMRMEQSLLIENKRLLIVSSESRKQFSYNVEKWIITMRKQLLLEASDLSQENIKKQTKPDFVPSEIYYELNSYFMDQFGSETVCFQRILQSDANTKFNLNVLLKLFNSMRHQFQDNRFFYFSIFLYELFNFQGKNRIVSKKIFNILKNNIRDEEILREFSISFQLQNFYKIIDSNLIDIDPLILDDTNEFLRKIHPKDFVFISKPIVLIFNKLTILQNHMPEKRLQAVIYYPTDLFQKFFQCSLYYYQEQLFEEQESHRSIDTRDIYQLLIISQSMNPSQQKRVFDLFCSPSAIQRIKCFRCKAIAHINGQMFKLLKLFDFYFQSKINQEKCRILQTFFELSKKVVEKCSVIPQTYMLQLVENVLGLGQLLCCTDNASQKKYHGLQRYFEFALSQNKIEFYIKANIENSFPIYCTLLLLYEKSYQKYINFLIRLIFTLESSMIQNNFNIIFGFCSQAISKLSQNDLLKLFKDVKSCHQSMKEQTCYIIILYSVIFHISSKYSIQKQILPSIMRVFHKLHSQIQRQLGLFFILKAFDNIDKKDGKNKRRWISCNNRAAKLIIIEGKCTLARKKKPNNICQQKMCLQQKMERISYVSDVNQKIKFRYK